MHSSGRLSGCFLVLLVLVLPGCGRYANDSPGRPLDAPAFHEVSAGETLYSISWQYGYDYKRVANWNGIDSPYTIYPGQRIRLRANAAPARPREPQGNTRVITVRPSQTVGERPSASSSTPQWRWPTEGAVVKTFKENARGKKGIEIAGRSGQPIYAAAPGRIVYSGNGLKGYGNLVIIKHDEHYLSAYAYNSRLLVGENDTVQRGQQIAEMGSGTNGAALHFEIRRTGRSVDPLRFLPKQ